MSGLLGGFDDKVGQCIISFNPAFGRFQVGSIVIGRVGNHELTVLAAGGEVFPARQLSSAVQFLIL